MSAATSEHTDWRGEDVSTLEVAQRLRRLNREHTQHGHRHAATRTLNLLVAPGPEVDEPELWDSLTAIGSRHPSRTIVLLEHDLPRIDARAAIDCEVRERLPGHCHDAVVLTADGERLRRADSLVRPLLVGGLPIVLWLPGSGPSPAEDALAGGAQAIVLDASAGPTPARALRRAARLIAEAVVHDLAWLRLRRWRQRVAAAFDLPQRQALLTTAQQVQIRFAGADATTPLLLAGWVAARAGWSIARIAPAEGGWRGEARRPDGAGVEVMLAAGDADGHGVHELVLTGPDDAVVIVEPVAGPARTGTLAAALQRYDARAPGYVPALHSINQGLAGA